MPMSRRKTAFVLAACFLLGTSLLAAALVANWMKIRNSSNDKPTVALRTRVLPEPRPGDYVGSQRCKECHEEIFERYQSSPMYQATRAVNEAKPLENYDDAEFLVKGNRGYRVERDGDRVLHHEFAVDDDGETIYDQAVPVHYTVGSGNHGRSYLTNRDGILFQSPITWYANGDHWGLSPGYMPEKNPRFERRVDGGCLYCHVGNVSSKQSDSRRFGDPPFLEAAIGCEQCHGPGGHHVELTTGISGEPPDDLAIVNPAKLPTNRRESVCNHCHLQGEAVVPRFGRTFFDFRPGDLLDDTLIVFVNGERVDRAGRTQAVSHVDQMRSSKCFQGTNGELGCISCHDAHGSPTARQRVDFYRGRCLNCHQEHGCSLDEREQNIAPANGSCIHCHMPPLITQKVAHTALSDHRVRKRPGPLLDPQTTKLELFDHAEERVPPWEIARARGSVLLQRAKIRQDHAMAFEALQDLLPPGTRGLDSESIIKQVGDDPWLIEKIAGAYTLLSDYQQAEKYFERLLELEPDSEVALEALAQIAVHNGDISRARMWLARLIEINPYIASVRAQHARWMLAQGDTDAAIIEAKAALELDPTMTATRIWLADVYEKNGNLEKAKQQRATIERLVVPRKE